MLSNCERIACETEYGEGSARETTICVVTVRLCAAAASADRGTRDKGGRVPWRQERVGEVGEGFYVPLRCMSIRWLIIQVTAYPRETLLGHVSQQTSAGVPCSEWRTHPDDWRCGCG